MALDGMLVLDTPGFSLLELEDVIEPQAFAELYPEYNFSKHKGYGTKEHTEALLKYGPCPIHRKTFLKKILG